MQVELDEDGDVDTYLAEKLSLHHPLTRLGSMHMYQGNESRNKCLILLGTRRPAGARTCFLWLSSAAPDTHVWGATLLCTHCA